MSGNGVCHICGYVFQKATGNFCGKCGARRQRSTSPSASGASKTAPPPTTTTSPSSNKQPSAPPSATTTSTKRPPLGMTGKSPSKKTVSPTSSRPSSSSKPTTATTPSLLKTAPTTTSTTSSSQPPPPTKSAAINTTTTTSTSAATNNAHSSFGGPSSSQHNTANSTLPPSTAEHTLMNNTHHSDNNSSSINNTINTTNSSRSTINKSRPTSAIFGTDEVATTPLASSATLKAFTKVQSILESARLENLMPKFIEMNITDEALPFVEEEDLTSAGVTLGAHRRQLLAAFVPDHRHSSVNNDDDEDGGSSIGEEEARLQQQQRQQQQSKGSRRGSQQLLESSALDHLSDTQLYQEKMKNKINNNTSQPGENELSESPYNNRNNDVNAQQQESSLHQQQKHNTAAPIQTIQIPEDGSLLSPELLETANAPQLRDWKKGNLLGRGSFGACWFGLVPSTGKFYAVKTMGVNLNDPTNPNGGIRARDVIRISREISMMRRIQHENVCQFYGCVYNSEEREVCLFMELMLGGTLSSVASKFRPLPLEIIRSWTKQLVTGLAYLHSKTLAHRDIKADNVLVDANTNAKTSAQLKLADFGAAKRLADEFSKTSTVVGSPYWLAPELLTHTDGYDAQKADIYSLGNTICEMITGRPPWPEKSNGPQAILMIAQAEFPTQLPKVEDGQITQNCLNFVKRCFVKEPKDRPSSSELLQDPWLKGEIDP